jgi:hypothetical protein
METERRRTGTEGNDDAVSFRSHLAGTKKGRERDDGERR